MNDFTNKKILVTGASGFVGSFLAERLADEGALVYCLVRKTSSLSWLKDLPVKLVYGDLNSLENLAKTAPSLDYVFHTAALKSAYGMKDFYDVNYIGTRNLLDFFAKKSKLKRFVYISSLAVMGPNPKTIPLKETDACSPLTKYGKSKLRGEDAVREYSNKIRCTIIRPPVVYGPRDKDLLALFKAVKMRIKPVLAGKKRFISVCFGDDLVSGALAAALSAKTINGTYFIGNEKGYSWEELGACIEKALGVRAFKVRVPESMLKTLSFLSEYSAKLVNIKCPALNTEKALEMLPYRWICDVSKIRKDAGFKPKYALQSGIDKTVAWYKTHGWL